MRIDKDEAKECLKTLERSLLEMVSCYYTRGIFGGGEPLLGALTTGYAGSGLVDSAKEVNFLNELVS